MPKVSISKAARLAGISRPHLYRKYINQGLISTEVENDKPVIDTSELVRVFPSMKIDTDNTNVDVANNTGSNIDVQGVVTLLKEQLQLAKEQIIKGEEREKWLMQQLEKTTHMLEDKTQKETTKRKKILGIF